MGYTKKPTRFRVRTKNPGLNRLAAFQPRINSTSFRIDSYNLIPCLFDGPFLSVCYKRRPICRNDEILCKKNDVFCCYKPLCDILPGTLTTVSHLGSVSTTIDPIDYCNPYGNYILVFFFRFINL